jgi:hypothetical protein
MSEIKKGIFNIVRKFVTGSSLPCSGLYNRSYHHRDDMYQSHYRGQYGFSRD